MGATRQKTPKNKPADDDDDDKGTGDGDGDEGGDPGDKPMTAREVNAAITKALRGAEKRSAKTMTDALTKALTDAGFTPKSKTDDDGDDDDDAGDDTPAKPAAKPAAADAGAKPSRESRELRKLRDKVTAMEAESKAAAEKLAREQLRRETIEGLNALGVRKENVPMLATWMMSPDVQAVKRNDAGDIVFVFGEGDDADEMPLKEGLAAWAKTDQGKSHLAPKPAGGTGAPSGAGGIAPRAPGQPAGKGNGTDNTAAANNDLFRAVMGEMSGAVLQGDGS